MASKQSAFSGCCCVDLPDAVCRCSRTKSWCCATHKTPFFSGMNRRAPLLPKNSPVYICYACCCCLLCEFQKILRLSKRDAFKYKRCATGTRKSNASASLRQGVVQRLTTKRRALTATAHEHMASHGPSSRSPRARPLPEAVPVCVFHTSSNRERAAGRRKHG